MRQIGDRLDELMRAHPFYGKKRGAQTALAQKTGIPQSTISRILSNSQVPEVSNIRKLAAEFNVNSEWLISEQGPKDAVTASAALTQNPNVASATATLGPVPSLSEMRDRVREAVANARARDALPSQARDLILEVLASTETGVTPVIFALVSRHLADLTDTLRASLASVQPMDERSSGSESVQIERGRSDAEALSPRIKRDQIGHDDKTGTTGGSR